MLLFALLAPLLTSSADAFCGNYVGPLGSSVKNQSSKVILVRNGSSTTLTIANDVTTDVQEFGLVIPVPEVLAEDDVRLADASLFAAFDGYSAPRLVSYSCDDFVSDSGVDYGTDDTGAASGGGGADGVVVEAEYTVGSYDIAIVSATGADGLSAWLDANGFTMDDAAVPILEEYIAAGQYFVAARVNLDALGEGGAYLEPLQLHYTADAFSLPLRLGTTSALDTQSLTIFAITTGEDGAVGVSNYPETAIEDDCMVPDGVSPEDYYVSAQEAAFAGGVWMQEYAWQPSGCDPCSSEPPSEEQLRAAGVTWDVWDTFFTRLHLTYAPESITEDLMLYPTRMQETSQVRFITYNEEMEDRFPVCGVGMVEDPGSCYDGADTDSEDSGGGSGGSSATDDSDDSKDSATSGCGCASAPSTGLLSSGLTLASLLGGALLLRRRSPLA